MNPRSPTRDCSGFTKKCATGGLRSPSLVAAQRRSRDRGTLRDAFARANLVAEARRLEEGLRRDLQRTTEKQGSGYAWQRLCRVHRRMKPS